MKKIMYSLLFASIIFSGTGTAMAQTDWNNLPANEFIKTAVDIAGDSQNVAVEAYNVSYFYKKMSDKKPTLYIGTSQTGTLFNSTNTNLMSISSSTVQFEIGKTKPKYLYEMSVISDGKHLYFKPAGLKNKTLRNTWIKATSTQYRKFGEGLGVSDLFSAYTTKTTAEQQATWDKIMMATKNTQLWKKYSEDIDDDITVKNATRYNFEYNSSGLKPYFTELTKTLSLEEAGYSVVNDTSFIKSLSDENVTAYIADNSYMSIWIDTTSKMPVKIINATWLPITEKKKTTYVLQYSEITFSKYNSAASLIVPASSVDVSVAAKQLKIKL